MKKEIIAVALAAMLTVSSAAVLAGCGEGDNKQATTAPSTAQATTQATTVAAANSDAGSNSDNSVVSNNDSSSSGSASSSSDNSGSSSSSDGLVQMDDNAKSAVGALGLDTQNYYAVETGATQGNSGMFKIYDIYDYNSNYYGRVYVHGNGSPIYTSTEDFESIEKGQVEKGYNVDSSNGDGADGDNVVSSDY